MNGHAAERDSACKKCKAQFIICQEMHQSGSGWKICLIPCSCGKKHYPDKAKQAKPLNEADYIEYAPSSSSAGPSSAAMAALLGSSSSHARNPSAESEDPLQWSPDRLLSEGGLLTTGMAALSITAQGSDPDEAQTVEVSARWNSDGLVTLKSLTGEEIATINREAIHFREDGVWVYMNGTWYFAPEIRGAKKVAKKAARRR